MAAGCPECGEHVPRTWRLLGSIVGQERDCARCGALLRVTYSNASLLVGAVAIALLLVPGHGLPMWMMRAASGVFWVWFFFGAGHITVVKHGRGRCAQCGYDRAGLGDSAVCPECRAAPAAQR